MNFLVGNLYIVFAGVLLGIFTFPLKRTPGWQWEHTWGVGSFFALILFPLPLLVLTISHPLQVLEAVPPKVVMEIIAFGLAWGFGGVTLGLAVDSLGTALGMSLVTSIATMFGSIGPILIVQPAVLATARGFVLLVGLAVMVLGIATCGVAGRHRERDLVSPAVKAVAATADENAVKSAAPPESSSSRKAFFWGLVLCIVSGFLGSLLNFAFVLGAPLRLAALGTGTSQPNSANVIWALVFAANYIVNAGYCLFLMIRRGTAAQLVANARVSYWGWALFLGAFWALSIIVYGLGANALGTFGAFAGYPMFLVYTVLISNLVGKVTGEWKGSQPSTRRIMYGGVAVLVVANVILAYSAAI